MKVKRFALLLAFVCAFVTPALRAVVQENSSYYSHVFFDSSLTSDQYFYSGAHASGASFLEQKNDRLPVETKIFLTPPNAIRLQWQSQADGGWEATVRPVDLRNRLPELSGHNLYLWIYSTEPIAAEDLPRVELSSGDTFTAPIELGKFSGNVPAGRWIQVRIPFSDCQPASI